MKQLLLSAVFFLIFSCNNQQVCQNTNPVFNTYSPESSQYKEELLKELKKTGSSELTYWFDRYEEKDGRKYIHVNVQGDKICAVMVLAIEDSTKGIEKIIENKGVGYAGSELKDLVFSPTLTKSAIDLNFISVSTAID